MKLNIPGPDPLNPLAGYDIENLKAGVRNSPIVLDAEPCYLYPHQYNFSYQSDLGGRWTLRLGYVGSRTHKLFQPWTLNRARPVQGIDLTTGSVDQRRPDQRYSEVVRVLNGSRAYYDAAVAGLLVPRWKGLGLDVSYWFSKSMDLGAPYTATAAGRDAQKPRSQTEFEVHKDLKGLSDFDQPHAFLLRLT